MNALEKAVDNFKKLRSQKMKSEGERLKKSRRESGLSQVGFAQICGVSQSHLCAMENGKRAVTEETKQRLRTWQENK